MGRSRKEGQGDGPWIIWVENREGQEGLGCQGCVSTCSLVPTCGRGTGTPGRPQVHAPVALSALLSGSIPTYDCSCLLADVGSVEGLAYHRGWDTLYWTSYTTSTITRHTVDQTRPGAFERETVITMSGDDHPRAFVLDECQK